MNHLEIREVSKAFVSRKIINNLSFEVAKGEVLAIVGESGSGKSTLLNMIGLLERVDSGEILLKGKALPDINSKEATLIRRDEINYIFQTNALISEKTVKDNLLIAMEFVNLKSADKLDQIKNILNTLGIEDLIDQKINTISGGEAQRVALARCILKPGDLILADEPTGSLDPARAGEVFRLLISLRDDFNKTIIIVTHDMDLARKCDSGEILLKGKALPDINSKEATLIRRDEINYIFQTNALISEKTVKDNLLIAMEFVNLKSADKLDQIKNILNTLGIEDLIDQKINTISGGEAQRVALARCILKPGDLILADEPTGSLDPARAGEVFRLLISLRDDFNKTIIIVTHDMDLARKCDRIIEIKRG